MAFYVSIYKKPAWEITVAKQQISRAGSQSTARSLFCSLQLTEYISELGVVRPLARIGSPVVIMSVTHFIKESSFLLQSYEQSATGT